MKSQLILLIILAISIPACRPSSAISQGTSISLASFTENDVDVSIRMDINHAGEYILSASFTPPEGYHLYSKDIPLNGVNGLGRPTLLELTSNSQLQANGDLLESTKAEEPKFEPKELFVYPTGKVTLSLPVIIQETNEPIEDSVQVTYMACTAGLCKPPVERKIILIHIPALNVQQ